MKKEMNFEELQQRHIESLQKQLKEKQKQVADLRNKSYTDDFRILELETECQKWKEIAEKFQADKNWELIEKITSNTPNCWAEVKRLDTDFCRIKIKGTERAYEVNLKGALDIMQDMFGIEIKARLTELESEENNDNE